MRLITMRMARQHRSPTRPATDVIASRAKTVRATPAPIGEANLAIEWLSVSALKPNPKNARTHNRAQIRALAASLREFRFTKPIIVDASNTILAGHGIFEAAKQAGYERVPIIRRADLSDGQIRQYVIADNRLAQLSGWDFELLALEFKELEGLGLDLSLTGFEVPQIDNIIEQFATPNAGDDFTPPSNRDKPIARTGELYLLGRNRVLCGDATSAGDVERLMDGAIPALMVTDPPYGVSYDPSWRHEAAQNRSRRSGPILNDDRADWLAAWVNYTGDVAYVWHAALHANVVQQSLEAAGFDIRAQIIWVKNRLVLGRGDYHWAHEPCFYAVRKGRPANWAGGRKQTTVWHIAPVDDAADSATNHATQKPAEVMRRPMANSSRRGQIVFDPFLGSGSSVIAAEQSGRIAYGLELDPKFVDVVVERWESFTGKDALLAGTNATFAEIKAERSESDANQHLRYRGARSKRRQNAR